ncbi:bifunctional metallophosphatase/5'-nucleotidase [Paramagnetospirillum marisnigri]|uniref:Bifunctional metallophosphatase/5'-nucleotidase n=1 Tax=Paramagnetospirillum marisnigri TaxID=1285242 RepID=A0A178MUA3_9PROT|nr:5'-nucleotidase C-terminal domain-containing protein [Paramagnetospirillum marisnigri]OAN52213.1 bifunctional metallophosphatase/5'-nucleotidase [Paramagnetospirillum marisnigri]
MIKTSWLAACLMLWASGAAAEQLRLTFLHVNDIYEYRPVDGQGGLAELQTRIDQERAKSPLAAFTFGGDLISPSLASNLTKGAHMIEFFNALAPVAAVPGNHEFDAGPANFAERIAQSSFPWVGTNVLGSDGKPFGGMAESLIREINGVKVGFLGVLTARTRDLAQAEGVTFTDEMAAAQAMAHQLRAQGAEVVVALTHLDLDEDRKLALRTKGVDLVLGGHDHDPISVKEDGALVLKAGNNAHWLGVVDLVVDRPDPGATGPTKVVTEGWRFVRVAGAAPAPALLPLVARYDTLLAQALDQPLTRLDTAMDSRGTVVRSDESAVGNLFADALREHFKAELALINGGGLRGNRNYAAGTTLTRRDILTEMPFGNAVMAVDITGKQLLAVLEYSLSGVEAKAGRFPQVSGMAITYDGAKPPGSRVISVRVGAKPLEPSRVYRLATSDYLGRGGDGYKSLTEAKVVVDASGGPLLVNVVADYLAARTSVAPKVEGRVVAVR